MTRIAELRPDELTEDQRRLYQAITDGPRGRGPQAFPLREADGRLRGPFNAMLLSPGLGYPLQELGAALRHRGALSPRARELVTLTVANTLDSPFEREAHEASGRQAGLTDDEIMLLREGRPPELADRIEASAVRAARHLLRRSPVDDGTYRDFGLEPDALFEVILLVGYYTLLADLLRVFAPAGG
jgi:4-carboxymuconolactone decarboxylase